MSVIATFTIPAADFTLGATIRADPSTTVRLDRVIPTGNSFIPYFWAASDSVGTIESDLRAEADIDSFRVVDSTNGEALIRVDWSEQVDGLLEALSTTGASILEGVGEDGVWRLQLRFDEHDDLSRFFERCAERGIEIELESIHNPGMHQPLQLSSNLTEAQRETLSTALTEGYFDVPRGINLVELAERLNISDSAVSQRIRRGVTAVLNELAIEPEPTDEEDSNR